MNYYTRAFENYFNFRGRDSRKQFWMFVLINFIVSLIVQIIAAFLPYSVGLIITSLYSLAIIIPSFAIHIRRLHDVNKSGFWIFINLIPLIGTIWYFILLIRRGDPGENRFGPAPME